ncbi:SHOCT domain-containing protein [Hamadaea sp. NPDC051192]|uniref:SHOCT domain-containing protein n=1 Tax=Hamadaea sp. NPDC051192 TaxID=3154940 RepID=UPI00343787C7
MTMDFGDVLWSMIVFFFWFMFIWMFIAVFADVFRRKDLSGWGKAGWIAFVVILPFLGALVYLIARPKPTEAELRSMGMMPYRGAPEAAVHSTADEIERLSKLHDDGKIDDAEYATLKQRAMGLTA